MLMQTNLQYVHTYNQLAPQPYSRTAVWIVKE